MTTRVLIIGGYGNFGRRIAEMLAPDADVQLIIGGRSLQKAQMQARALKNAAHPVEPCALDIFRDIGPLLKTLRAKIVVHTSGPYQGQGYEVAKACIATGVHYLDLADGREFVSGIFTLDAAAKAAGVSVISGASSVPALTSAVIEEMRAEFGDIRTLDYGITTAQRTTAGAATTAAILGYIGKPIPTIKDGKAHTVYGWQGLCCRLYPELGARLLGYCDVPDLGLFPQRYPTLQTIAFRAGAEVKFLHICLWLMSWPSRWGWVRSFAPLAERMNRAASWFDRWGSDRSGFHLEIGGVSLSGEKETKAFYLLTADGHGPYIPCVPSVLCVQKIINKKMPAGAYPCVGFISLFEYLQALTPYSIKAIRA